MSQHPWRQRRLSPFTRHLRPVSQALFSLVITLIGLLIFTFMLSHLSPVDPVLQLAGDHASESTYQQIRTQLGLDQPLPVQFWRYLCQLAKGNLGVSHVTGQPVLSDLMHAFPATIELATSAMLLGAFAGVSLALCSAWKPGSWLDNVVRLISLLGYSVPVFWVGLLSLFLFYARLHWSAGPGRLDDLYLYTLQPHTGFILIDSALSGDPALFFNAIAHLWLPVVVLGTLAMASLTRLIRVALLEESQKDYVVLAKAKGCGQGRIVLQHLFPNISATMITVLLLTYASLLEGSVLTEIVFAWPGIGRYMTMALFAADTPAILGTTLLIGLCYIVINAVADRLIWFMDPRTR